MKLSETTIGLLKNFSAINPNMVFNPGNTISTMAEAKNILATAKIGETIEQKFGIYDLNEFLSAVALVDDPTLSFSEKSVTITDKDTSIEYHFSSPDVLTAPTKEVKMPSADVKLDISEEVISKIKKAAAVFGHATLAIVGDNGRVTISVLDEKNSTSNRYSIVVDENNSCKESFSFVIVIGNLKMLPGDYSVEISSKLISKFQNKSTDVTYFIALEKSSTFGAAK